jgi:superfamily II DNA or RNA helicase
METTKNNNVLVNIIKYNLEHDKFKEQYLKSGDVNRPKTINKITSIGRRNKFIIDYLQSVLEDEPNRKILVLSDRIEHLKLLKTRLDTRDITISDFYIGGMKQSLLDEAEKAQVIFASYGMAAEALDIPDLNTLFMVTSRKEVEQAVGRIIRKVNPNIRPTIYDMTDQLPCFVNQGYSRRRLYKKKGFEIKIIDVFNNEIIKETNLQEINDISEVSININEINNNEIIDFID